MTGVAEMDVAEELRVLKAAVARQAAELERAHHKIGLLEDTKATLVPALADLIRTKRT